MKKIIAMIVAVAMTFSCVPFPGSFGEAEAKTRIAGTDSLPANDSLAENKGFVKEYIEEAYEESIKDREYYCDDVWKEIQDSYSRALKIVDGVTKSKDLFETDGIFVELSTEIDKEVNLMMGLGALVKHYVKSKSDLKVMKRNLKKDIALFKSQANKSDYNDFYWGKLQNLFYDSAVTLKKINSFRDYIILAEEINSKLGQASMAGSGVPVLDALLSDIEEGILIPLVPVEEDEILIIIEGWEDDPIYNKDQVEMVRQEVVDRLNNFVDKQMDMAKSNADKDALKEDIANYKEKTLDKLEDVAAIHAACDRKIAAIVKKTGVDCPDITKKDFIKVAKEYNTLTGKYSQQDYSPAMWAMVEAAFQTAKSVIQNAVKQYEVYGIIKTLDEELKIIPAAKKEFNDLKKRTIKKLKSYTSKKNRKKYSQPKVKVVIKKGVAALGKVEKYDVDALQEKCDYYIAKANKCIKKFRIKTVKKGKGSITKTRKVAYGKKCVVKITPKAGYKIKSVKIDGKKKKLKNKYVFKKVKKAHTVRVVFGK